MPGLLIARLGCRSIDLGVDAGRFSGWHLPTLGSSIAAEGGGAT